MKTLQLIIRILLHPSCWLRMEPYNPVWDKCLNNLMDKQKIIDADEFKITFEDGQKVWVANQFYSYGMPYYPKEINVTPKRATMFRLHDLRNQYLFEEELYAR